MSKVKYEDIFSEDVNKQKQVTQLFENLLKIRNNILNNLLMTFTGHTAFKRDLQGLLVSEDDF